MRISACEGLAVRATQGVWCSKGGVSSSLRLDRLSLGTSCISISSYALTTVPGCLATCVYDITSVSYDGWDSMSGKVFAALCLVCLCIAKFELTVDWNCCRGRSVRPSGMRSTITNHRMEMDWSRCKANLQENLSWSCWCFCFVGIMYVFGGDHGRSYQLVSFTRRHSNEGENMLKWETKRRILWITLSRTRQICATHARL